MKKCPRCNHELNDDDKFCPHCGLDLEGRYKPIKQRNKSMTYLLYVIIFFSFFTIPILYTRLLTNFVNNVTETSSEKIDLPKIENSDATSVLATFDTVADFQNQFSNIDDIIVSIHSYEKSLPSEYQFDKSYKIQVLDNYDIRYSFKYTTKINDDFSLVISKECNRSQSYDNETYTLEKENMTEFKSLLFNDDEMKVIENLVGEQSSIQDVMNQFSKRETEFESKKKKLGHYGIGNYNDDASFVVNRYQETYTSKLTYTRQSQNHI